MNQARSNRGLTIQRIACDHPDKAGRDHRAAASLRFCIQQVRAERAGIIAEMRRRSYSAVMCIQLLRAVSRGAWRDVTRNLIAAAGGARPVQVAEITASGFRIAAGAPLMGRREAVE